MSSKIFWIGGDCLEVMKKRLKSVAKDAVVFGSPPWGGEWVFSLSLAAAAAFWLAVWLLFVLVLDDPEYPRWADEFTFLPPGPSYNGDNVFDLSTMQPYSLKDLYDPFAAYAPDFVLYLPRSSDLNQIAKYAPKEKGRRLEVTHYCMSGWSKVSFGMRIASSAVDADVFHLGHLHLLWRLDFRVMWRLSA